MKKISFRENDDGQKVDIFVNRKHIGHVEINLWNQKWTMHIKFHVSHTQQPSLSKKYDSSYEAGKAMATLYDKRRRQEYDANDTDEYDMREFFQSFST